MEHLLQDPKIRDMIQNCIYKNITAKENFNREKKINEIEGDMTEVALYKFLKEHGYDVKSEKKPDFQLPFNSEYKYMISIYKNKSGDGYMLYLKGALEKENAGSFLTKYFSAGGKIIDYSEEISKEVMKVSEDYSKRAFRNLMFAYKELSQQEINTAKKAHQEEDIDFYKDLAKNCTFAFLLGMRDQYRDSVPKAIQQCKLAGITVRMVTGDNIDTAIAISKEVGIISRDEEEIAKRNNDEIKEKMKDLTEDEAGKFLGLMKEKNDVFALEGEVFRKISGNLAKNYDKDGKFKHVCKYRFLSAFIP